MQHATAAVIMTEKYYIPSRQTIRLAMASGTLEPAAMKVIPIIVSGTRKS